MLSRWRKGRRPIRLALLGVTLVAFVVVATGLIALFSARPALGAQSTLTVLGGTVAVRAGEGEFAVAADGQLIGPGVTIRTGPGSNAILTYVDGTTVTIEPDSELVIEQLELSASGDLVAVVQQAFGRTWHVVQRQLGAEGRYEVRTPAATAAVRGTAFVVAVADDGAMDLHTTEGVVAAGNDLSSVDVGADQRTSVALDTAPEPPRPAPAPQAVVRILLEPTQNAVAVDASGRSVGVQNGVPLRYAPGSKVEMVDGRLVLTIPTNEPGRISTIVQRDDEGDEDVEIETEIVSRGAVVSNTTERRQVDDSGTARGGVVLTTAGVIVLPDSEADRVGAPIIGKRPEAPAPPVFGTRVAGPSALPTASTPAIPREGSVGPSGGATGASGGAPFVGAFQPFQPGGGGALIRFTAEPPRELLPPPPPSKEGCTAFALDCRAQPGEAARPEGAVAEPAAGPAGLTFIGQITEPTGPSVFDRATTTGSTGGQASNCRATRLGQVCGFNAPAPGIAPANITPASGGGQTPEEPAGQRPGSEAGAAPSEQRPQASPSGGPQGGFVPRLPLAPVPVTGPAMPPPAPARDVRPVPVTCTPPGVPLGGKCVAPPSDPPREASVTCTAPSVLFNGRCFTPPPIQCPSGLVGTAPNCTRADAPPPPAPDRACPQGTSGVPPLCVPVGGSLPGAPAVPPAEDPKGDPIPSLEQPEEKLVPMPEPTPALTPKPTATPAPTPVLVTDPVKEVFEEPTCVPTLLNRCP